jgi:hypothetical protein
MNLKKCAFGVSAGQFLGFLVHERGIEIGLKSQEAVRTMMPPTTKRELQQLIGKINFVRRFISNLSGRIEPFMELVKIKANVEFRWGAEQQRAFEEIKKYLSKPPVLVPVTPAFLPNLNYSTNRSLENILSTNSGRS